MKNSAVIIGATGLVGNALIKQILKSNHFEKVTILVRKPSGIVDAKLTEQIIDFGNIKDLKIDATDYFCCLGTTMAVAKTKANFEKVDYEYPLEFGKLAKSNNALSFSIITAAGASTTSAFYYSKVKGRIENELKALHLSHLAIFRPSMLLGDRKESRLGEKIGQVVMNALDFLIPDKYKAIEADKIAISMLNWSINPTKDFRYFESDEMYHTKEA